MLGKNKKGGWIGVGEGVGTAIAVATKEPAWIAVGIAIGAAVISASNLKSSKTEKNKEQMISTKRESKSYKVATNYSLLLCNPCIQRTVLNTTTEWE